MEIGRKLELEVRGSMRKIEITEHMVDNDTFDEETLEDFPREETNMSTAQMELEKTRILARAKIEKAKIEQETRIREMGIRQTSDENRFEITKQVHLLTKFVEKEIEYLNTLKKQP